MKSGFENLRYAWFSESFNLDINAYEKLTYT